MRGQLNGPRLRVTDEQRRRLARRGKRLGRRVLSQVADDCLARYDPALAPPTDRAQVDLCDAPIAPAGHPRGDPTADRADGGGESDLGLYEKPRCVEEPRASRPPFDDCPNAEDTRDSASAGAPDITANIPAGALGAINGTDFFTTEVWTWRGLVTYYTLFVIDLALSRSPL